MRAGSWLSLVVPALITLAACVSTSTSGPSGSGSCPCTVGNSGISFTVGCGQSACYDLNGVSKGVYCSSTGPQDDPSACLSSSDGGGGGRDAARGPVDSGPPVAPEAGAPTCGDAGFACTIDCQTAPSGCQGNITCAPGQACNVGCDRTSACQGAAVECNGATSCALACTQTSTCQDTTVYCGDGPCDITCTGLSACQGMVVVCGSGPCNVTCTAGTPITQYCGSSSSCTKSC